MILVIAEKPSVANSIADVLGANNRKDGFREGNGYIVSWCVGHLVEPDAPDLYSDEYKKWTYESLPIIPKEWRYSAKSDTMPQFKILKQLMNRDDVTELVEATDAGREGELIFRLTYNQIGCKKPFKRLWISSMEEKAIREGFDNLKPGSDYDNLFDSAMCRQKADWLVGMNGTRLFTVLYNSKTLKIGRVVTPTLGMIVNREIEIMNFKKKPYYTVELMVDGMKAVSGKFDTKEEAEAVLEKCEGANAVISSIKEEEKSINPPKLFDLTSLQREANKLYGLTAKKTLDITQNLYEKKCVTYPRTDSQYLSDDMSDTAVSVLREIKQNMPFIIPYDSLGDENVSTVLNSKKVSDHHAIIPTVQIGNHVKGLSNDEKDIIYLISTRMLEATAGKHIYKSEVITLNCGDTEFTIRGKVVLDNGWKFYADELRDYVKSYSPVNDEGNDEDEDDLTFENKNYGEGEILGVTESELKEKFTKAPSRYTEATLLTAMERAGADEMDDEVERKGIGTPATRAETIEKLVKDKFVTRNKKNLVPTQDGMNLINVVPDKVKSVQLTSDWENALLQVQRGELSKDEFLSGIEDMVKDLVKTYNRISENPFDNREVLGKCPKCEGSVVDGKFGPYCKNKCGMVLNKIYGKKLTKNQVVRMLEGKVVQLDDMPGKNGSTYSMYAIPVGAKEFNFIDKDGNEKTGYGWAVERQDAKSKKRG